MQKIHCIMLMLSNVKWCQLISEVGQIIIFFKQKDYEHCTNTVTFFFFFGIAQKKMCIKGIVHPKMQICWKFTHPQVKM